MLKWRVARSVRLMICRFRSHFGHIFSLSIHVLCVGALCTLCAYKITTLCIYKTIYCGYLLSSVAVLVQILCACSLSVSRHALCRPQHGFVYLLSKSYNNVNANRVCMYIWLDPDKILSSRERWIRSMSFRIVYSSFRFQLVFQRFSGPLWFVKFFIE